MSSRPKFTNEQKLFKRLMISIVELSWVGLRYIGIYSKDTLDHFIDLSHPSTPNSSKSRKIERQAIMRYIERIWKENDFVNYNHVSIEMEDKEVGYYNDEEWEDDFPYEITDDDLDTLNGDNFPYISHMKR